MSSEHPLRDAISEAAIEAEFETGVREETVEEARDSIHRRLGRMLLGFVLLIAGIVMLAIPGPGLVTMAAGLVILARDFVWAERLLLRVKRRLPADEHGEVSRPIVVGSVMLSVTFVVGSLWWTFIR